MPPRISGAHPGFRLSAIQRKVKGQHLARLKLAIIHVFARVMVVQVCKAAVCISTLAGRKRVAAIRRRSCKLPGLACTSTVCTGAAQEVIACLAYVWLTGDGGKGKVNIFIGGGLHFDRRAGSFAGTIPEYWGRDWQDKT